MMADKENIVPGTDHMLSDDAKNSDSNVGKLTPVQNCAQSDACTVTVTTVVTDLDDTHQVSTDTMATATDSTGNMPLVLNCTDNSPRYDR
jgi:hypothetical protein